MHLNESPTLVHELLADAPFRERHTRIVDAPLESVWRACTDVTAREVRLLAPLMNLRGLPARRRSGGGALAGAAADQPLLDTFVSEGFVLLRADDEPVDGRASLDFGAAGRFWSIADNHPVRFATADEFIELARDRHEPGLAVTIANLCAIDNGDGTTTVSTETRVDGTDAASTNAFGRYWLLICLGSGAIRRSWLAAIDRRARA